MAAPRPLGGCDPFPLRLLRALFKYRLVALHLSLPQLLQFLMPLTVFLDALAQIRVALHEPLEVPVRVAKPACSGQRPALPEFLQVARFAHLAVALGRHLQPLEPGM